MGVSRRYLFDISGMTVEQESDGPDIGKYEVHPD